MVVSFGRTNRRSASSPLGLRGARSRHRTTLRMMGGSRRCRREVEPTTNKWVSTLDQTSTSSRLGLSTLHVLLYFLTGVRVASIGAEV